MDKEDESKVLYDAFLQMNKGYERINARYPLVLANAEVQHDINIAKQFLFDASQNMLRDPNEFAGLHHHNLHGIYPDYVIDYAKTMKSKGKTLGDALCGFSDSSGIIDWLYQGSYDNKQAYKKNQERFAQLWLALED